MATRLSAGRVRKTYEFIKDTTGRVQKREA